MTPQPSPTPLHRGYMLLEVLISILLFAVGILGTLAIHAASVKHNSDAKYRIDASFLANALIARMWTDDRAPAALAAQYSGGGDVDGPQFTAWLEEDVPRARLPGIAEHPPRVSVTTVAGSTPPATSRSLVTITISWQSPGDDVEHRYVATTEIK